MMNKTVKTVLLTIIAISALTIAVIELSGISTTAIINLKEGHEHFVEQDVEQNDAAGTAIAETDKALTSMHFDVDHHNFGTIKEGVVAKHQFKFINSGSVPLVIERVIPSCGCTVPNYPTEPIAPGGEGVIDFEFNSEGRVGNNRRKITILANIESESRVLTFEANVEPK